MADVTISKRTQRRFLLGKQGLYPGRRWRDKEGVASALRAGAVMQVDPINVVARSHDIALYGRVLDYRPALLQSLLYEDRVCFEYGGAILIHPIEELPYWRVVMARKQHEPRRVEFAREHAAAVEMVREAIEDQGPLSAADFQDTLPSNIAKGDSGTFRSGKVANQALYYLWIAGEIMTHHRQGVEHVYDLRERLVPAVLNRTASAEETDAFFALKVLQRGGLLSAQQWRASFAGTIERKVMPAEVPDRLDALLASGAIARVLLADAPKTPYFVLADDLPLLELLEAGGIPDAWRPLETTTEEEVVLLAPLEIVSARGRALALFDFEYLWEVYKPPEQRRWGYYTLPMLYQDRLVARTDLKLDRAASTLVVKGFWLESHAVIDDQLVAALAHGFGRFMRYVGADALDATLLSPPELRDEIESHLSVPD